MKSLRPILLVFCGLSSLAVSACGEGWEMVMVRGQVPYTDERTAGPGVAYVRAHLMPEKGPVVEPIVKQEAPVFKDAAPLFNGKMQKK